MNFEKYTDRARGFVQSAQTYALGQGHQQFTPEHLLKVLLDDPEGMAAGLIERAGGRPRDALLAVEAALAKLKDAATARILSDAGVTPTTLNQAINDIRKGRTADTTSAESGYDALKKYARDL